MWRVRCLVSLSAALALVAVAPPTAGAKITSYVGEDADPCAARGIGESGGIIRLKDVGRGEGLAPTRTAILCGPIVTYPALATATYDHLVGKQWRDVDHELSGGADDPVGGSTESWPWLRGPGGAMPAVEKLTGSKLLEDALNAFSKTASQLERTTATACATGGYVGDPDENACQDAAIAELIDAIAAAAFAALKDIAQFFFKSREEMGGSDWAYWSSNGSVVWNYFGTIGPRFIDPSMFHTGFRKRTMRAMVALSSAADGQGAQVFPGGVKHSPTINEEVGLGGSPAAAEELGRFRSAPAGSLRLNARGLPDPEGGHRRVRGSVAPDRLVGVDGDDTLAGRGGADVLVGLRGDDLLDGGRGFDVLRGGPGDDQLVPGPGGSHQAGGPGDDRIWGSTRGGPDVLHGGPGDDLLVARSRGLALLRGGPGDDFLISLDRRGGDAVSCGGGRGRVYADPGDRIARDCGRSRVFVFSRSGLRRIGRLGVVPGALRRQALRRGARAAA